MTCHCSFWLFSPFALIVAITRNSRRQVDVKCEHRPDDNENLINDDSLTFEDRFDCARLYAQRQRVQYQRSQISIGNIDACMQALPDQNDGGGPCIEFCDLIDVLTGD